MPHIILLFSGLFFYEKLQGTGNAITLGVSFKKVDSSLKNKPQ
jgi:hypothetical protein